MAIGWFNTEEPTADKTCEIKMPQIDMSQNAGTKWVGI